MKSIFVFGSNLAGLHGGGSARHAFDNLGAEWFVGVGRTGDCYAIPTKGMEYYTSVDGKLRPQIGLTLPLNVIQLYVNQFIEYAEEHPKLSFDVVEIGCGLAGFKPEQIAPMFEHAPSNVKLPPTFVSILSKKIIADAKEIQKSIDKVLG